jgi:DNA gyrase/topoisomerase IV subunit A
VFRSVQLAAAGRCCNSLTTVDERDWRETYAALLKQIREMHRQLARVQAEARAIRERTAKERAALHSVRPERRRIARFRKLTRTEELLAHRKRKKR